VPRPSVYQLNAAVQVGRWIDARGNQQDDVRNAYRSAPTEGSFDPRALRDGEAILLRAGLVELVNDRLVPRPALAVFLAGTDARSAPDVLSNLLAQQADDELRHEVGEAGEIYVLSRVRTDLETLGRPDLAFRCERVSLVSDALGYDIIAPRIDGTFRRLEVKTQLVEQPAHNARFFLTRNEYDVARARPSEWALVFCWRLREDKAQLGGWCRAATIATYLPIDNAGRWTEAVVTLPVSVLTPGFPQAV
jgi:hypothetical protein